MKSTITIEIEESKNNLSDEDREQLKQVVLHHAKCDGRKVLELAKELKQAFILLNS